MNRTVIAMMVGALAMLIPSDLWAQGCSVCTKVASGLGDKAAKGLNGGIVYLALLPLSILGTLGVIWWKSNKNSI
jgi:hypothetical protein